MIASMDTGITSRSRKKDVEMTEFDVVTKWLKIEVTINARTAQYLSEQTPFIISRYGMDVHSYALHACIYVDCFRRGESTREDATAKIRKFAYYPEVYQKQPGIKMAKITVEMEKWHWRRVEELAEFLGCNPRAIIRAALSDRGSSLRRFHEKEMSQAS